MIPKHGVLIICLTVSNTFFKVWITYINRSIANRRGFDTYGGRRMADWMALAQVNADRLMEKHRAEVMERHAAQRQRLKRKAEDQERPPEELKRVRKGKGYLKNIFSTMLNRASIPPNEEVWKVKCWVCPYVYPTCWSADYILPRNARLPAYTVH
jgi:hypothetical protein